MPELRQRKHAVDKSKPLETEEPDLPDSSQNEIPDVPLQKERDKDKKRLKNAASTLKRDVHGHYKAGLPATTPIDRYAMAMLPIIIVVAGVFIFTMLTSPYPIRYAICSRSGQVYITAEKQAECVVVNDDIVEFHGSLEETRTRYGDKDTLGSMAVWPGKLSFAGGLKIFHVKPDWAVYPGFTDAHGHIMQFGHSLSIANLVGTQSKEEIIRKLIHYINHLPRPDRANYARIVEGHGFDQTKWPGGAFPTAADLDVGALRGRKIYLTRIDIHACWLSPSLLTTLQVPDHIEGGVILRDEHGKPTGVFLDAAFEWVKNQLPQWTIEDRIKYFRIATQKLVMAGITGVHDAMMEPVDIEFFKRLDHRKFIPIRVYGMVACTDLDKFCGEEVEFYDGHHFTVRSAKLFLDGALGSWGAAMLEPYADKPEENGIARMSLQTFRGLVEAWTAKGFQVNTHAIGDAANRMAVDVYESVLSHYGETNSEKRFRIEHAQILAPDDIARAGTLGIIASVQPTHATSDMGYAELRLGPNRIKGAYAWHSLHEAGCPIALGSDFPVERTLPQEGFHAAVSRLNATNGSPHGSGGWYPQECLTRKQALEGFTAGPAYARFAEDKLGKLEVGMKADITIYDKDLMKVPFEMIRKTWARATIIDGKVVYGRL